MHDGAIKIRTAARMRRSSHWKQTAVSTILRCVSISGALSIPINVLYTAQATAIGGRNGYTRSTAARTTSCTYRRTSR